MYIKDITSFSVSQLLNWQHSLICIDLNNETFNMAAGFRRKFSRIFRLSSIDKDALRFNILDDIPGESVYKHVSMIADILLGQNNKKPDIVSKRFLNNAKDLLTAAILYCKCTDYRDKSMYGVLSFLSKAGNENVNSDPSKSIFDSMKNSVYCSKEIYEIILNVIMRLNYLSKKNKNNILNIVLNSLKIFEDPIIRFLSSSSDFFLNDFKACNKQISLFITITLSNFEAVFPYFAVIINMLYYSLCEDKLIKTENLNNPVLLLLDEHLYNKRYFKSIYDDYCKEVIICHSKFNSFDKGNKSFEFLNNTDNDTPPYKGRDDFMLECAGTTKPGPESKRWFHVPDEAYMVSEDIIYEPIFTSQLPNDEELKQNNLKQQENNKCKMKFNDMEIIYHNEILNVDLFFNKELNEHIKNMKSILQENKFREIKKRIMEINSKIGVTCMLFGESGTGKSEVVSQ
jgi:hypothetical protein